MAICSAAAGGGFVLCRLAAARYFGGAVAVVEIAATHCAESHRLAWGVVLLTPATALIWKLADILSAVSQMLK